MEGRLIMKRPRIILAKCGLDGHENGIKIVSQWLRDEGFEVLYLGLYNTPEGIIRTAIEENIDIIGLSFLEGAHIFYFKKIKEIANKMGLKDIKFVIGGVIPPDDIEVLKQMGVAEVFTPGTSREKICTGIKSLFK
jgi:methylmalonyl-CoA mutase C-terminal domain/subunit